VFQGGGVDGVRELEKANCLARLAIRAISYGMGFAVDARQALFKDSRLIGYSVCYDPLYELFFNRVIAARFLRVVLEQWTATPVG
jgi:hypothetical protein